MSVPANRIPLFAPDGLARLEQYDGYGTAEPFPHLVLDGIFNPQALRAVLAEWPLPTDASLEHHDDGTYSVKKLGTTWQTNFGSHTHDYLTELAGPRFLQILQHVTGIHGLIGDPYLFGGGLHAISVGGRLAVHVDFNKHPVLRLDRRLNLLVYLNEDWSEENGGCLELWDHNMKEAVKRMPPVFNRTVLFSTTRISFHGHPEPIVGPRDLWRQSIALYYYSNGRPEEEQRDPEEHSTLWQARPVKGY
jgi:hypothetical protein